MYYFLDDQISFPHPESVKPSGILAISGDLTTERLLLAYLYGIFPWYNENEPIIWWCPNPRYVIFPDKVKIAKSMNSYFNKNKFHVTYNQCFKEVMQRCMETNRIGQQGTWLNDQMIYAYSNLFLDGFAVSVEVWEGDELVGGLYGVKIGKVFYGESMFSLKSNASKFGFITLSRRLQEEGFWLIDCQQPNHHLESLGGEFITGNEFQYILAKNRMLYLKN